MADKLTATDDKNMADVEDVPEVENAPESVPEATEEPTENVPTETAPTPRTELVSDAKSRSLRTGFQTALSAAVAAVLMVCATYLKDGDLSHIDWKAFAMAAATAGLPPIVAFLQRMLEG
jgi:hypothetical protein